MDFCFFALLINLVLQERLLTSPPFFSLPTTRNPFFHGHQHSGASELMNLACFSLLDIAIFSRRAQVRETAEYETLLSLKSFFSSESSIKDNVY